MSTIPAVKNVARQCIERMNEPDLKLGKRKRRDEAALHYFIGAAVGAGEAGNNDLKQHLTNLCFLIAIRGFEEVEAIAAIKDNLPVKEEKETKDVLREETLSAGLARRIADHPWEPGPYGTCWRCGSDPRISFIREDHPPK